MIPNDHAIMLFRFSEKRWMQQFAQGKLSFSCAGAFIAQAKHSGNNIQGDKLEGVFAHLLRENPQIEIIKNKYIDEDIEEIEDGKYIFLRRKSAKFIPIFCFFAFTAEDAINVKSPAHGGMQEVNFDFDPRLFEGFANKNIRNTVALGHEFALSFVQPKPFINHLLASLLVHSLAVEIHPIKYRNFKDEEFFVEPTDDYPELFIKSDLYTYQHEVRVCLKKEKFGHIFERFPLEIVPLRSLDIATFRDEIHVVLTVDIQERTNLDEYAGYG